MSYCASVGGGSLEKKKKQRKQTKKNACHWSFCGDRIGCLGDGQIDRGVRTHPCSSIDGVEARFQRRRLVMWKYHCGIYRGGLSAGEEQVDLTNAAWGAIEQTGLLEGSLLEPAGSCWRLKERFLWNPPWRFSSCLYYVAAMWWGCPLSDWWASMSGSVGRKVFTRMWHVLNKLGASVEVSGTAEYVESESVTWKRD